MKKLFIAGTFGSDLFSEYSQELIENTFYCEILQEIEENKKCGIFMNSLGVNPITNFLKKSETSIYFRVEGVNNYPPTDFFLENKKDIDYPCRWIGTSLKNNIKKDVSCVIIFDEVLVSV